MLFCLLSFYSFGTAMMDYFLLYPSRFIVGDNEFVRYHTFLESAILPTSVFPFLIVISINIVIFWFRPVQVSKKFLWMSIACLLIDLASTILFQAPWNFQLSHGKDIVLMQKITDTNWVRVFLETAQVVSVYIMLKQLMFRLPIDAKH
jgi:hypothetical protein